MNTAEKYDDPVFESQRPEASIELQKAHLFILIEDCLDRHIVDESELSSFIGDYYAKQESFTQRASKCL